MGDVHEKSHAALLELSRKLSLGNESVVQEVSEAIQDPEVYLNKWKERLDERCISKAIPELPWFALVDALIEEQLANEVDWKEDSETLEDVIEELLERKHLLLQDKTWFEVEGDEAWSTAECLEEIKTMLQRHSIALACLDIDSDCYVLVTVPIEEIEALKTLASEAGYRIDNDFA